MAASSSREHTRTSAARPPLGGGPFPLRTSCHRRLATGTSSMIKFWQASTLRGGEVVYTLAYLWTIATWRGGRTGGIDQ